MGQRGKRWRCKPSDSLMAPKEAPYPVFPGNLKFNPSHQQYNTVTRRKKGDSVSFKQFDVGSKSLIFPRQGKASSGLPPLKS